MPAALTRGGGVLVLAAATTVALAAPALAASGPFDPGSTQATGGADAVTGQIGASVRARMGPVAHMAGAGAAAPTTCFYAPGGFGNYLSNGNRATTRVEPNGQVDNLYAYICNGATTFYWVAAADPATLAQEALASAHDRLPGPAGVFSPDVLSANAMAVVNVPLRVGVSRWLPVKATAAVPGLSATVTATPSRLEFMPGDGSAPVACTTANGATAADSCSYTYRDASSVAPNGKTWSAQIKITWDVGWVATNGAGGVLAPLTTTTNYAIPVGEIEAIEQPR